MAEKRVSANNVTSNGVKSDDVASCGRGEDGRKSAIRRLKDFPCFFYDLQERSISVEKLQALKRKVEGIVKIQRQSEENAEETHRTSENVAWRSDVNLSSILVYVHWKLQEEEEAQRMAEDVVRMHPNAVLSRTNMAYILLQKGNDGRPEENIQALKKLQSNSPAQFEDLIIEARLGLAYFYELCGHDFFHHAMDIYEIILEVRPEHGRCKLYLSRAISNSCRVFTKAAMKGRLKSSHSLERAVQLLNSVKENSENSQRLRGEAASELGTILSSLYFEDEECRVLEKVKERMDLDAETCFGEALQFAKDDPSVLLEAAKFYGRNHKEKKAVRLLEQLIVMRPNNAVAHYRLAVTLKKRACKARGWINPTVQPLELVNKSPESEVFSRDDRFVNDIMKHLYKATELEWDRHCLAHYDLGLMHKALSEPEQALYHFGRVIAEGTEMYIIANALEQSSQILLQAEKKVWISERKTEYHSTGHSLLRIAVMLRCRIIENHPSPDPSLHVWTSLQTLSKSLHGQLGSLMQNRSPDEALLMRLLKKYITPSQFFRELCTITEDEAVDAKFLERKVKRLEQEEHFEDAALLIALLRLTSAKHVLLKWWDSNLHLRVHVATARRLLMSEIGKKDDYYRMRTTCSAFLFRWAFEDRNFSHSAQSQSREKEAGSRLDKSSNTRHSAVECSDAHADSETVDRITNDVGVLIVHEPNGVEDAVCLQCVLQDTCGLKTKLLNVSVDRSAFDRHVTGDHVTLLLLTSDTVSSELKCFATETVSKVTKKRAEAPSSTQSSTFDLDSVRVIVKDSATVPSVLQGHRSMPWLPDLREEESTKAHSEGHVKAVCELFCFLIGLNIENSQ